MKHLISLCSLLILSFVVHQNDYLTRARDCFDRGEYLDAVRFYKVYSASEGINIEELIKQSEDCYQYTLLANALLKEKEFEKAENCYGKILEVNPNDPHAKAMYHDCVNKRSLILDEIFKNMILVPSGNFIMGNNDGEARSNEKPAHQITINNYRIGKYPISQKEWRMIMGKNPSNHDDDNLPIETVSWNDVQQFIQQLNKRTGKKYRLPTEAEWEYAARGGNNKTNYPFSGSNHIDEVAWYEGNSYRIIHQIGKKRANELGLYDMSGNVWEWCSDWYGENFYANSPKNNPKGPSSGTNRVARGGSWCDLDKNCRTSYRRSFSPDTRIDYLGFRLCLDQ